MESRVIYFSNKVLSSSNISSSNFIKRILFLLLIVLLVGITSNESYSQSANKLRKMGKTFEKNGSIEKAADYYYQSLVLKPDNVKAILGLERTASEVMNKKLEAINYAFNNEFYQTVYNKYNEALSYQAKIKKVGIDLEISLQYSGKYNESKDFLAEKHYALASKKYDNGNYQSAIEEFEKCLNFKAYYKDANNMLDNAKNAKNADNAERYYKAGVSNLNDGNYRKAYYDFEKCISYKSTYKDAVSLKREALNKGKVRIGIFDFINKTRAYRAHNILYSYVVSKAVNYKSPFIEIIDRENLKRLLKEQKLGMSGIIDESSAAQAGKVLGLDYVVIGKLVNVIYSGGKAIARNMNGFEVQYVKNSQGNITTKKKAVTYKLYEGSSSATYEAQYQIISIETSQIIKSNIVSASSEDNVKYATYRGDYKKLHASDPEKNNIIGTLLSGFKTVDAKLFTAKQQLIQPKEMETPLLKTISTQIANEICSEFD